MLFRSWKYTLPAFIVPFIFVLDPLGVGVLLKLPKGAGWGDVAGVIALAFATMTVLAAAAQGWLLKRTTLIERLMLIVAGGLMLVPQALWDAVGIALAIVVVVLQKLRRDDNNAINST